MNQSGQGAIEYLLIIAAAILVVAIVILAVTGALGGGQDQTNTSTTQEQTAIDSLGIKVEEKKAETQNKYFIPLGATESYLYTGAGITLAELAALGENVNICIGASCNDATSLTTNTTVTIQGTNGNGTIPKTNLTEVTPTVEVCSGTATFAITETETCSAEYGGTYTCDKASNGNVSDHWFGTTAGTPKWVYGDLGSKKCISGVRANIFSLDVPQTMDIQVSDDAINWTTVETGWTVTTGETFVEKPFTEIKGRYIRFYITSCNRSYCNFHDFEVKSRSLS